MALRKDYQVSTRPVTMQDAVLNWRTQRGDLDAFVQLILARTDLTEGEVLALEMPEVNEVAIKISEALNMANTLAAIGEMIYGPDSGGD